MIISNGHLIFVRVRTAIRIHCTREEIEREFRDPIMQLRYVPGPGPVIRELWVYSRYGIWRFFRIEDTSIMEICQDGTPLKNPFQVVERTVRAVYPRNMGSALV